MNNFALFICERLHYTFSLQILLENLGLTSVPRIVNQYLNLFSHKVATGIVKLYHHIYRIYYKSLSWSLCSRYRVCPPGRPRNGNLAHIWLRRGPEWTPGRAEGSTGGGSQASPQTQPLPKSNYPSFFNFLFLSPQVD